MQHLYIGMCLCILSILLLCFSSLELNKKAKKKKKKQFSSHHLIGDGGYNML